MLMVGTSILHVLSVSSQEGLPPHAIASSFLQSPPAAMSGTPFDVLSAKTCFHTLEVLSAGWQVRANLHPYSYIHTHSEGKKTGNGYGPTTLFAYKSFINTVCMDNTV